MLYDVLKETALEITRDRLKNIILKKSKGDDLLQGVNLEKVKKELLDITRKQSLDKEICNNIANELFNRLNEKNNEKENN